MTKEITLEIKRPEIIALLLILVVFFAMNLRVILNSPIAFGDEGFHTTIVRYMGQEKEYPVYNPVFGTPDEKSGFFGPPIFHLLEASFGLLGYHEVILKILTPFIGAILVGLIVFLLGKKIWDRETSFIGSIMAVTVPSIVTYSVLLYRDALFTFFFTMFTLSFILALKTDKRKYWIIAGVFSAFTFLTKTPGYASLVLIGLVFLYQLYKKRDFLATLKRFSPIIVLFILITSTFFLRNLYYYKTPVCNFPLLWRDTCSIKPTYEQKYATEYTGAYASDVGTNQSALRIGLINYFNFAYGNIYLVPLAFICGLFLLSLRKQKADLLIFLVLLSFLPVIYIALPGRAEDTARFTLALVPTIALIAGNWGKEVFEFIKKYYKPAAYLVFILVIFLSYQNINEKLKVMKQVKQFSPAFFEGCDWIKQNTPKDAVLGNVIWAGATGYNCERDVGGGGADVTLGRNLTLTLSLLKHQGSTHIFVQKFSIGWNDERLTEKYPISFVNWLEDNPDHFIKVFENGPSLDQCRQMGGCDGTLLYEINYSGIDLIPISQLY